MPNLTAQDFRQLPESEVSTPMFETEDGDILAFGHVNKKLMISEIPKLWDFSGTTEEMYEFHGDTLLEDEVQYTFGTLTLPAGQTIDTYTPADEDWHITYCTIDTPNAIAISVWRL